MPSDEPIRLMFRRLLAPISTFTRDLRGHLQRGELLRQLTWNADCPDRLVVFTASEALWAPLDPLADLPAAATAMALQLVSQTPRSRAFRTGRLDDGTIVVLEVRRDGGWWLACLGPDAQAWDEREGVGLLPEPVAHWWPSGDPVEGFTIAAMDLPAPDEVRPIVGIELQERSADWEGDVAVLAHLLPDALVHDEPLAVTRADRTLVLWSMPDDMLGGDDELLRALARGVGADAVGRVDLPPMAEDVDFAHVQVVLEVGGARHVAEIFLDEDDANIVHTWDAGRVSLAASWLQRCPTPPLVHLFLDAGLVPMS